MAKLFYARISKIDYEKGLADITIEEHEKQVINDVPFLAGAYEMPKIKERVAVLLEYSGKDFDKRNHFRTDVFCGQRTKRDRERAVCKIFFGRNENEI